MDAKIGQKNFNVSFNANIELPKEMEMSKSNEHGNRSNIFTLKSNGSNVDNRCYRTSTVNYTTIYKSHHQTEKKMNCFLMALISLVFRLKMSKSIDKISNNYKMMGFFTPIFYSSLLSFYSNVPCFFFVMELSINKN